MARVSGEILINRLVEQVFDYVADQRNEPIYKPSNDAGGEDHGRADRGRHAIPRDGKVWPASGGDAHRGHRVREGQEVRLTDRNALCRYQRWVDLRAD